MIYFKFSKEIKKEEVIELFEKTSDTMPCSAKHKIKNAISRNVYEGIENWNQIFDILNLYKKFKIPKEYITILTMPHSEENFKFIFELLLKAWMDILLQTNGDIFKTIYYKELENRKNIKKPIEI